jgi:hypothetical protein
MRDFRPAQIVDVFDAVQSLIRECSRGEGLIPVKVMIFFTDFIRTALSEVFLGLMSFIAPFKLALLLNSCFQISFIARSLVIAISIIIVVFAIFNVSVFSLSCHKSYLPSFSVFLAFTVSFFPGPVYRMPAHYLAELFICFLIFCYQS